MPIEKVDIENFLKLAEQHPVIDVRSPLEYQHAHIPGACHLPLFTDEERKVVGTLYKQKGRQQAIKQGLDYFGLKMRPMVEEVEWLLRSSQDKTLLIHCWRGGMRSAGVAWLMDLYGFKVYTLTGGYKRFRNYVLDTFTQARRLKILGGYTGSGKTEVLDALSRQAQVIQLETLARHKGSAFGDLGQLPQPSQEMFENELAMELRRYDNNIIWLEDESQRIGDINIPNALWQQMKRAPLVFLQMPFEMRLNKIIASYGSFDKSLLAAAINRIQKRLGGLATKQALNHLEDNNIRECFRILLKYYDKYYNKALMKHSEDNIIKVLFDTEDYKAIAIKLINSDQGA